jgi:hypothetical protein
MRVKLGPLSVAVVFALLLAACSGNGSSGGQSALPEVAIQNQFPNLSMPPYAGIASPAHHRRHRPLKELVIADPVLGGLMIFDNTYHQTGSISVPVPVGTWVDASENAYAASPSFGSGVNVSEYNKAGSLIFTYTTSLTDPVNVTTDTKGHVYVANNGTSGASVVEYPQASNVAINTCETGLNNEGVAVDGKGDVFVSGNGPNTNSGVLLEYKQGLSGCKVTTLGAVLDSAGGLQLDNKGDLVACDQPVGVDIIPPPYSSISKTITVTGGSDYHADALYASKLFVVDSGVDEVYVLSYPGGTLLKTLGPSNGLYRPSGIATYPFER